MVPSGGEFFMEISIGTPKIKVPGNVDTGSDLTWIQCKPCKKCFKQKPQLFDPQNSSTYKLLPCESPYCISLMKDKRCDVKRNVCGYKYLYGDGSFSEGNIGSEKFAIALSTSHPVSFSKIIFSCGHSNVSLFDEVGSGIIGIGGGPLSLISQLGSTIKGKFSYCLVPTSSNVTSKITFGMKSLVSGHNVVSTPLVDKEPKTFYYVTLEVISVGKKRLAYTSSSSNISQKEALEEAIGWFKRVRNLWGLPSVCFKVRSHHSGHLPIITVHYTGADVKLPTVSSYFRVQKHMVCLTMIASYDISILGNLSQMNLYAGYDLEKKKVFFKPADCTKHSKNA
ncbi:hypothetical protein LWI29_010782 [Acer saccharum]|uniref:Peptidase A1 domain-containing protein n=1 Tax=Acer saccharum TaxID=4024 RepID=A0AA39VQX5_ACESA|nr:hypothetical protein LWI29_010782 [Acer saccharum]